MGLGVFTFGTPPGKGATRHTARSECFAAPRDSLAVPFEFQPTLTGELVELRPLREDDWAELFAVASDPLIWELHPQPDRYKEEVFRRYFRGAMDSGGAFAVIDRATGKIIGSSRYHDYNPEKSQIEIGYTFLARSYWGGTYNAEMKRLMLTHAFTFVDCAVFVVGKMNYRSQRAMEKIGGQRTGELVELDGRVNVVYEIRKPIG